MKKTLPLLLLCLAPACTSTNFIKTGFETAPPRPPGPCSATVLQDFPADRQYVELGLCTTSMPGGGLIADKTPKAVQELQECACKNGGNAIVLLGSGDSGYQTTFGYSQQTVKASAKVLFVFPK